MDFSLENLGLVSEAQGEMFHQSMKDMELKYHGRMDKNMQADNCWMLNEIDLRLNIKEERQKRSFKKKENVPKKKLCFDFLRILEYASNSYVHKHNFCTS
ncbi:hypothetical protein TNCV_2885431 [Trichonephila clavipes]|nr:hypothetical protein TNCV_2885431 [Trichonephila clavipes]